MSELPKIVWDDDKKIVWDGEKPSHSTLDVVGQYSGRGTKNLLNLPRDAVANAVRYLPYIAEFMTNPGMTGARAAGLPMDVAPSSVKTGLNEAAQWIEKNFDVGRTYDYFGVPHQPPPPEELTTAQRVIGKSAEVASGALPITAAISRGPDLARQVANTLAGSALAGPGYEAGGPAGEFAGFLTGAGAASGVGRASTFLSVEELLRRAKGLYQKGEAAAPISAAKMRELRADVGADLAAARFDPNIHTKVEEAVGHLARYAKGPTLAPNTPVDIKSYDVMRDGIRQAFKGASADEGVMLRQMLEKVDSLLPAEMRYAADLTRRAKRSESLEAVKETAGRRAVSYGNALRNEVSALLGRGKEMRYFRPEEAGMVSEIVTSPGLNAMRLAGKFAPSRGAFNTATHVLGGASAPGSGSVEIALLSAVLSQAAKEAATRMTSGRITGLQEYIQRGGPAPVNLDVLKAMLPALGAQDR